MLLQVISTNCISTEEGKQSIHAKGTPLKTIEAVQKWERHFEKELLW